MSRQAAIAGGLVVVDVFALILWGWYWAFSEMGYTQFDYGGRFYVVPPLLLLLLSSAGGVIAFRNRRPLARPMRIVLLTTSLLVLLPLGIYALEVAIFLASGLL